MATSDWKNQNSQHFTKFVEGGQGTVKLYLGALNMLRHVSRAKNALESCVLLHAWSVLMYAQLLQRQLQFNLLKQLMQELQKELTAKRPISVGFFEDCVARICFDSKGASHQMLSVDQIQTVVLVFMFVLSILSKEAIQFIDDEQDFLTTLIENAFNIDMHDEYKPVHITPSTHANMKDMMQDNIRTTI